VTTFVILAAGKGTRVGRVGENLHKALLPVAGQAVLSHLFDLTPPDAHILVVVGDRAEQIMDYVQLAHPGLNVSFVYDKNPHGPGASLLTTREFIDAEGGDLVFTSCDTLWRYDEDMWKTDDQSWVGAAPVPAGTDPERWCRFALDEHDRVVQVLDKVAGGSYADPAYVGLARISAADLPEFWAGIVNGERVQGELQVSGGFRDLELFAHRVHWTDVGDEVGYRRAVAEASGYDWTKLDQATYVLEDYRRVVKYSADPEVIKNRALRSRMLGPKVAPELIERRGDFLAYGYVAGETAYASCEVGGLDVTESLLRWYTDELWHRRAHPPKVDAVRSAMRFYKDKSLARVDRLREPLRSQALAAVNRTKFLGIAIGVIPGTWHGDLNHGNVIVTWNHEFYGIDWREDFAGETSWGDLRYDVAKLLAGTVVHWDNARRGDFRPWEQGSRHARSIRDWIEEHVPDQATNIEIIGALSLINSAPLHAEPLDEILVARGVAWLEEVL
jgi:choline kinase